MGRPESSPGVEAPEHTELPPLAFAGIKQAQDGVKHAVGALLGPESGCEAPCPGHGLQFCDYANATICEVSVRASRSGRGVRVLAYNPLAQEVRVPIAVPIAQNESLLWTVTGDCCCAWGGGEEGGKRGGGSARWGLERARMRGGIVEWAWIRKCDAQCRLVRHAAPGMMMAPHSPWSTANQPPTPRQAARLTSASRRRWCPWTRPPRRCRS